MEQREIETRAEEIVNTIPDREVCSFGWRLMQRFNNSEYGYICDNWVSGMRNSELENLRSLLHQIIYETDIDENELNHLTQEVIKQISGRYFQLWGV